MFNPTNKFLEKIRRVLRFYELGSWIKKKTWIRTYSFVNFSRIRKTGSRSLVFPATSSICPQQPRYLSSGTHLLKRTVHIVHLSTSSISPHRPLVHIVHLFTSYICPQQLRYLSSGSNHLKRTVHIVHLSTSSISPHRPLVHIVHLSFIHIVHLSTAAALSLIR